MRRVWAVAKNTIAQALRMKVAGIVIVLLIVLLPLMSMIMIGDGTLKGKLQTFISYGLSLTSLLLCVLTIIISTHTLTSDIKRKQIHLVVTKPICRFQIICGKFFGVLVLDVFLLVMFSAIIYLLVLLIPPMAGAGPAEIVQAQKEFFTARTSLTAPVDEEKINKLAMQAYEKLKKTDQLPPKMSQAKILAELRGQEKLKARTVEVGSEKIWEFENVEPREPNEVLFVRYKYEVSTDPPDYKVHGIWLIGDYRQVQYGPGKAQTPIARVERSDLIRTFHEFEVPAEVITPDGYLGLVFHNPFINKTTVIPEEVEVLYRADFFTANYIRAVLVILSRLIFLAALGVSVSTWLSFPVAILICLVIFSIGTVNGFLIDSIDDLGKGATIFYSLTIRPILWFLPCFDGPFNPTQFMVSAKMLSWVFLVKIYAVTVFIKSVLLVLFGIWIFSNREIARIAV